MHELRYGGMMRLFVGLVVVDRLTRRLGLASTSMSNVTLVGILFLLGWRLDTAVGGKG